MYVRMVCLGVCVFIYWNVKDVIYLCMVLSVVVVEGRCVCLYVSVNILLLYELLEFFVVLVFRISCEGCVEVAQQ